MHEIIYENTMSRIRTRMDLAYYRVADLIIPLDELEIFLPEIVSADIVNSPTVNSIFCQDNIEPSIIFNGGDKFFRKDKRDFVETQPKAFENINEYFLQSKVFTKFGFKSSFLNIGSVLGLNCTLNRSNKAIRKIICYWIIDLRMKSESVYNYQQMNMSLPIFGEIYPPSLAENWWNQTVPLEFRSEDRPWLIDERLFDLFLERKLAKFPQIKTIEKFIDKDRDNSYFLNFDKEKLILSKGLDHKYLPYYKEKFDAEEIDPT